jgi:hypothetical protein
MRAFYRDPAAFSSRRQYKALLRFLTDYAQTDMLGGFGALEMSERGPGRTVNVPHFQQTVAIVRRVMRWSPTDVTLHVAQERPGPVCEPEQIEPPIVEGGLKLLFDVIYATVLALATITSKGDVALKTFLDWLEHDLGMEQAIETQLAVDLFLGTPSDRSYVQGLLKLNSGDLADVRGAAWDAFLARLPDLAKAPSLGLPNKLALVTSDKKLAELRRRIELMSAVTSAGAPVVGIYAIRLPDNIDNASHAFMTERSRRMTKVVSLRRARGEQPSTESVRALINILEAKLQEQRDARIAGA